MRVLLVLNLTIVLTCLVPVLYADKRSQYHQMAGKLL